MYTYIYRGLKKQIQICINVLINYLNIVSTVRTNLKHLS